MKKFIFRFTLIFTTLAILSGLGIGLYFYTQLLKLKDHYPVFHAEKNRYILEAKKPKHWVSLNKISKDLKWAIVVSEDWAFYQHDGIDLNQINIVIEESLKEKKLVRGASTITQQVIKNSILSSEKTILRKAKEIVLATAVEKILTKDEILELYLNLVELGKNIYGVKAASLYYFNKHPSSLNAKEGAFLAMLLPSPIKYGHSFRDKKLTPFATETIGKILIKMRQAKKLTEEQRLAVVDQKLSFEKVEIEIDETMLMNSDSEDTHMLQW